MLIGMVKKQNEVKIVNMKRYLIFLLLILFTSCEKEYSSSRAHVYSFQCLIDVDQWGIETWGGHQFIVKDKIQDISEFKECYVKYLCWNDLDIDCFYKKQYYIDDKFVKIRYEGTTYNRWTLESINDCNIEKRKVIIIGWIK
jgi:hypothetical protein